MTDINTVDQVVALVATSLKDAAAEYGPMAVDLALMAYRVEAARILLVAAAIVVAIAWPGRKTLFRIIARIKQEKEKDAFDQDDLLVVFAPLILCASAVGAVISLVYASDALLDLPLWLSAFGYPELMIATKALKAAGAM